MPDGKRRWVWLCLGDNWLLLYSACIVGHQSPMNYPFIPNVPLGCHQIMFSPLRVPSVGGGANQGLLYVLLKMNTSYLRMTQNQTISYMELHPFLSYIQSALDILNTDMSN